MNQDRCDEQLPNPHNILLAMVMWTGLAAAITCPLGVTGTAFGLIPLTVGIGTEMTIWSLGAAWFATCLAYQVRGEVDGAEAASRPEVSG